MAELFDDHSPLQIGARGVFDGVAFALIGRLQYRHESGTWNEWRALFDDGREQWLSEDNGQFVITQVVGPQWVSAFEQLVPGETLSVVGRDYVVSGKSNASVIAGEGELPFRVAGGFAAPVVDLRDPGGGFATLDYSDFVGVEPDDASGKDALEGDVADRADPTRPGRPGKATATLYVGRAVRLVDLSLSGLRETMERRVSSEQFACPSCGAPVQAKLESTKSLTCATCASVIDLGSGTGGRFEFVRQERRFEARIPIGMSGRIDGVEWTVTGFQRRRGLADGESFHWTEYLLHSPMHGFRFLVEDRWHWSFVESLQASLSERTHPLARRQVRHDGRLYSHFSSSKATVDYVEGEFYWQVRKDDETLNDDYIAPPFALSRERSGSELSWSLGRYITPQELQAAFPKLKPLPQPVGIGMMQASPPSQRRRYWLMTAAVFGLLVLMQAYFMATGSTERLVADQVLDFRSTLPSDNLIDVKGSRNANLVVQTQAPLLNNWYAVDVELASRDTPGTVFEGSREVAYYEGTDSDGRWTEGAQQERLVFSVPPGKYLLRVSGRADPKVGYPAARWSASQTTRPGWLLFWAGVLVLWVWNLFGVIGAPNPERLRWRDSDHGTPPRGFDGTGKAAQTPTGSHTDSKPNSKSAARTRA